MSDVEEEDPPTPHNPEVLLPVHPTNEWHVPELIGKMWASGELQDALTGLGYVSTDIDPNIVEPCSCLVQVPGTDIAEASADCDRCHGAAIAPIVLVKSRRWVKGGAALRLPILRTQIVSPYSAACVVAAMAT